VRGGGWTRRAVVAGVCHATKRELLRTIFVPTNAIDADEVCPLCLLSLVSLLRRRLTHDPTLAENVLKAWSREQIVHTIVHTLNWGDTSRVCTSSVRERRRRERLSKVMSTVVHERADDAAMEAGGGEVAGELGAVGEDHNQGPFREVKGQVPQL
jgi:hypothetical protein